MSGTQKEGGEYALGQTENATRLFALRTVKNTLGYLIDHLKPDMKVLDIGCGPGSITVDLAKNYVPQGSVTGVEPKEDSLESGKKLATDQNVQNVDFQVGDAMRLPFDDDSFDLVYTNQVLMFCSDPVQALKEMQRVTKPGGITAAKEGDHNCFILYPMNDVFLEWLDMYEKVAKVTGGDPFLGRRLKALARQAGFNMERASFSCSNMVYTEPEGVKYIAKFSADRTSNSPFTEVAISKGIATKEKLDEISRGWLEWGDHEDAVFNITSMELIYRN